MESSSYSPFLDGSPWMRAIGTAIENIADTDVTVLIRGESGVVKDMVARAIHAASSRRGGPFVKIKRAAIPPGLLESELFGAEKGARTGAHRRKRGQLERANRGTIYLDEIAELPLAIQAKLLRVLKGFQFSRVGGHELLEVDTRVIAATNSDLEAALARGEFRADLYYRLNVVEIKVPSLRERREEALELASRFEQAIGVPVTLGRNVHNGHCSAPQLTLAEGSLREIGRRGAREARREAILEVLEHVSWNRAEAARILKVGYKTLLTKISECGLTPPLRR